MKNKQITCSIHKWEQYEVYYWHPYGLEFPKYISVDYVCANCAKHHSKAYVEK